jgi:hypothetical protein
MPGINQNGPNFLPFASGACRAAADIDISFLWLWLVGGAGADPNKLLLF